MKKCILLLITFLAANHVIAQNKKIITTYVDLTGELVKIKTSMELTGSRIKKNWTPVSRTDPKDSTKKIEDPIKKIKDSLLKRADTLYNAIFTSATGVIVQFQLIIRKPRLLTQEVKNSISANLKSLKTDMEKFIKLYYDGSDLLIYGSKFGTIDVNPIVSLLEAGVKLYEAIKKIVDGERQKTAADFKEMCSLLTWDEINSNSK